MEHPLIKLGKDEGLNGQFLCDFVSGQLQEERRKNYNLQIVKLKQQKEEREPHVDRILEVAKLKHEERLVEEQEEQREFELEVQRLETEIVEAHKLQFPLLVENEDHFLQSVKNLVRGTTLPHLGSTTLQFNIADVPITSQTTGGQTDGKVLCGKYIDVVMLWILWLMLLCGVLYAFGWTVSGLFEEYNSRTVTTTTTERSEPFVWPDVTICSNVRYDADRLWLSSASQIFKYETRRGYYYNLIDKQTANIQSFTLSLTHVNQEDRNFVRRPFEVIFKCSFKGKECSYKNFTAHRHPYRPNCFTFIPDDRSAGEPGQTKGLKVVLNNGINYHAFIGGGTQIPDEFTGFFVSVHAANTLPDLTNNMIKVGTGSQVDIKIAATYHVRIDRPGHPCVVQNPSTVVGFDNYISSKMDCVEETTQNDMICQCRCQHPDHYKRNNPKNQSNVPPSCLQLVTETYNLDSKQRDLEAHFYQNSLNFDNLKLNLSMMNSTELKPWYDQFLCFYDLYTGGTSPNITCPTYCRDIEYSIATAVDNPWPESYQSFVPYMAHVIGALMRDTNATNRASIDNLLPFYLEKIVGVLKREKELGEEEQTMFKEETISLMQKSYALVNIYTAEDKMSAIVEEDIYGLANLLSDIGGNLGLWIGLSVLSAFQLFERLIVGLQKAWKQIKNRVSSTN